MCGIIGYLDKSGNVNNPVGEILLPMLKTLCNHCPDSAGVAVFGRSHAPRFVLQSNWASAGTWRIKGDRWLNICGNLYVCMFTTVYSENRGPLPDTTTTYVC